MRDIEVAINRIWDSKGQPDAWRIRATASRETIRNLLNGTTLTARPMTVEAVVLGLCLLAEVDPFELDETAFPVPQGVKAPPTRVKAILAAWMSITKEVDDTRAIDYRRTPPALQSAEAPVESRPTAVPGDLDLSLPTGAFGNLRPAAMPGIPELIKDYSGTLDYPQLQHDPVGEGGTSEPLQPPGAEATEQGRSPQDETPDLIGVRFDLPAEDELPEGPQRALVVAMHELHVRAGSPGVFYTAFLIKERKEPLAVPDEVIEALLRGRAVPMRTPATLAVVEVLATLTTPPSDSGSELRRFEELWDRSGGIEPNAKSGLPTSPLPTPEFGDLSAVG